MRHMTSVCGRRTCSGFSPVVGSAPRQSCHAWASPSVLRTVRPRLNVSTCIGQIARTHPSTSTYTVVHGAGGGGFGRAAGTAEMFVRSGAHFIAPDLGAGRRKQSVPPGRPSLPSRCLGASQRLDVWWRSRPHLCLRSLGRGSPRRRRTRHGLAQRLRPQLHAAHDAYLESMQADGLGRLRGRGVRRKRHEHKNRPRAPSAHHRTPSARQQTRVRFIFRELRGSGQPLRRCMPRRRPGSGPGAPPPCRVMG